MIDNIEPGAFLVTMTLIVVAWLIIGIVERRRARAEWKALVVRFDEAVTAGRCANVWHAGDATHICTLRYEHTGPHLDHEHEALHR